MKQKLKSSFQKEAYLRVEEQCGDMLGGFAGEETLCEPRREVKILVEVVALEVLYMKLF